MPERESFPALVDAIGHDPAKFLDYDFLERQSADSRVKDGRQLRLKARIRGIDRIEVIRAYRAVERALGRGPADGPREAVIRLLDQREEYLERVGERPDRLAHGPRRPCECCDGDDGLSAAEVRQRRREERERTAGTYRTSGVDTSETSSTTETSSLDAFGATSSDDEEVATDGGVDQ